MDHPTQINQALTMVAKKAARRITSNAKDLSTIKSPLQRVLTATSKTKIRMQSLSMRHSKRMQTIWLTEEDLKKYRSKRRTIKNWFNLKFPPLTHSKKANSKTCHQSKETIKHVLCLCPTRSFWTKAKADSAAIIKLIPLYLLSKTQKLNHFKIETLLMLSTNLS
jgi:hypothetical protein